MKSRKHKTSIVIDTNIFISAAIKPDSIASNALRMAIENCDIYVSKKTLHELKETLHRGKFVKYFDRIEYTQDQFIWNVQQFCITVDTLDVITDCIDEKDNKFLEVAVTANVQYLVSGDKKHLLSMNPYRGVQIITAREFIDHMNHFSL